MNIAMPKRLWAEFLGTFWLVFGGFGSAVLAATFVTKGGFPAGIGFVGVALAFGLTVLTGVGLTLTLIHLISIPVDNTSVNPARSLGVAWFAGAAPLSQVWLFVVAPIVGALIAGFSYRYLTGDVEGYVSADASVEDAEATVRAAAHA